jgi:hypothetical protein
MQEAIKLKEKEIFSLIQQNQLSEDNTEPDIKKVVKVMTQKFDDLEPPRVFFSVRGQKKERV